MIYDKPIIRAAEITLLLLFLFGILLHNQIFIGTAFVVAGAAGIIYRSIHAWEYARQQKKWFRINLSHRDIKIQQFLALIIGPIFIVLGILIVLNIINLKMH